MFYEFGVMVLMVFNTTLTQTDWRFAYIWRVLKLHTE